MRQRRHVVAAVAAVSLCVTACGSSASKDSATAGATTLGVATTVATAASPATPGASAGTNAAATTPSVSAAPSTAATAGTTPSGAAGAAKVCGIGNGQKATGDPIKIGAVITKIPGIDLSWAAQGGQAYFNCVNDNGGINGRPVQLIIENDELDPGKAAAAGKKLIDGDKVVLLSSGLSLLDCALNAKYYADNGMNMLTGGIAAACFGFANIAPINMGPAYSSQAAAEYAISKGAKKKIVFVAPKVPGVEYFGSTVALVAKANNMDYEAIYPDSPVKDGAAVALDAVTRAGDGGAVVLAGSPQDSVVMLQGAADQGLIDKVVWAAGTSALDTSLAKALGPEWDGKITINAELRLFTDANPDMDLYRTVMGKYAADTPLGSFSEMGFLSAQIAVQALMNVKGDITRQSANAAVKQIKDFRTDMLCKPWYFGDGATHLANNTDVNVTISGDTFKAVDGCTPISALDDIVKNARNDEMANG